MSSRSSSARRFDLVSEVGINPLPAKLLGATGVYDLELLLDCGDFPDYELPVLAADTVVLVVIGQAFRLVVFLFGKPRGALGDEKPA